MKKDKACRLDPRTGLILLLYSNIIAFTQRSVYIEFGWIAAAAVLIILCGFPKTGIKCTIIFIVILLLQWYILPYSPKFIATAFSIFANYSRRLFSCSMVGILIIKSVSAAEFTAALRKMHLPDQLVIGISVTLRYFPTMREQVRHINNAVRLRGIRGFSKIECLLVPMIISATSTAEELSAAAVTRGIEDPVPKTSITRIQFSLFDMASVMLGLAFVIAAFIVK